MSCDVLAMKKTCSGDDRCRRTCDPIRKHTRDVLTSLQGIFGQVSPTFHRLFGDASEKIRGLICVTSADS